MVISYMRYMHVIHGIFQLHTQMFRKNPRNIMVYYTPNAVRSRPRRRYGPRTAVEPAPAVRRQPWSAKKWGEACSSVHHEILAPVYGRLVMHWVGASSATDTLVVAVMNECHPTHCVI